MQVIEHQREGLVNNSTLGCIHERMPHWPNQISNATNGKEHDVIFLQA